MTSLAEGTTVPNQASSPLGYLHPALLFLLVALLFCLLFSYPYSIPLPLVICGLVAGCEIAHSFAPYLEWYQLVGVLITVFVFYRLGRKIDFARRHLLLAGVSFLGVLVGNIPGFLLQNTSGGSGYGYGLGYVYSFGAIDLGSILGLITVAMTGFMIPVAGLALAFFRNQYAPLKEEQIAKMGGFFSPFSFFIAGFVIVVLSFLAADLVGIFVRQRFPSTDSLLHPPYLTYLVPGYVAFMFYPVLFLIVFYFMGKKLNTKKDGLFGFAGSVFIAGLAGLMVSYPLIVYIESPSTIANLLLPSNLVKLLGDSVIIAIFVLILGFAAVSLGFVREFGLK